MNREQIRNIGIACGYRPSEQADNRFDLDDSLFKFAEKLIERFLKNDCEKHYYLSGDEYGCPDLATFADSIERGEIYKSDSYYIFDSKPEYIACIFSENSYEYQIFSTEAEARRAIDENKHLADIYHGED